MSEQSNQIGEISVGVTAHTGMLEAGLQKAEQKVEESARKMEQAQVQAAEKIAQAHTKAADQVIQQQERTIGATERAVGKIREARQNVEKFGQAAGFLGMITRTIREIASVGQVASETFRTLFITNKRPAEEFLKTLEGGKANDNIKALGDQIAALQKRLGQSSSEWILGFDFEADKSIRAQVIELEKWRGIYMEQAAKERTKAETAAAEAAALAEAKAVGETFKRLNAMRKAALRERMTDEERIIDDTNQKIEEAELELLRFKSVGRIEQAERVEEIIADIRETGLQKLADLQKKQDDERRKAAEEEAEQYQQDMFEKIAMQVELAEAQRKAAEEYAKQFEASAQRIQDALTNAFNASNSAAQAMTRQVTSDISQIIPLLQQLVRNQRR